MHEELDHFQIEHYWEEEFDNKCLKCGQPLFRLRHQPGGHSVDPAVQHHLKLNQGYQYYLRCPRCLTKNLVTKEGGEAGQPLTLKVVGMEER